ncbi:HDOD domain-containing protein [Chitinilyticum litopenaei]|uniref:HDOD domain-containing protein n=1 Tax=Chitinilyticum litopenaei TaxID=1121276 RepID=UPI000406A59E|nr:HDOD domain-containing protein [Chitinilyticum litopenaei]
MTSIHTPDKPLSELRNDRLAMLQDIAKELEGDVVFPVCFDATVQISTVMKSQTASLQRITHEVQKDPLITSKLLKLANSVTYNPSGQQIIDLGAAITRLGMEIARSTALACAMEQLVRSRELAAFETLAHDIWQHSLRTAMCARVIAMRLTRVNPELAMLAGLVHDLGAFFLLDRANRYPELHERPKTVEYLVAQWHESIGTILLDNLGLPEEVIEGVRENDQPRPTVENPRTLSDVIYVANLFAGGLEEIRHLDLPGQIEPVELTLPKYLDLKPEMDAACAEMMSLW